MQQEEFVSSAARARNSIRLSAHVSLIVQISSSPLKGLSQGDNRQIEALCDKVVIALCNVYLNDPLNAAIILSNHAAINQLRKSLVKQGSRTCWERVAGYKLLFRRSILPEFAKQPVSESVSVRLQQTPPKGAAHSAPIRAAFGIQLAADTENSAVIR